MFLLTNVFDPNRPFCMGYRLTKMIDFQNALMCPIFSVFLSGILRNKKIYCSCKIFCSFFLDKKNFLTQTAHFAWAIHVRKWSIFKMLPLLEYLVFFLAVFSTEQLHGCVGIVLSMVMKKNFWTQTAHSAWAIDLPK